MPVPNHGPHCKTKTYRTPCPECGSDVFFFSCTCGSQIYFDTLAPDWAEHECILLSIILAPQSREKAIQSGLDLMKRGRKNHAALYFAKVIASFSQVLAKDWMTLASVLEDPSEVKFCYERALLLNPESSNLNRIVSTKIDIVSKTPSVFSFFSFSDKVDRNSVATAITINEKDKYKCNMCPSKFSNEDILKSHIRIIHGDIITGRGHKKVMIEQSQFEGRLRDLIMENTLIKCQHCGEYFLKLEMRKHIRIIHKL